MTWSWADVPGGKPGQATWRGLGGNARPAGRQTRFLGTASHADREGAGLSVTHPAVAEGRTLFRRSVVSADDSPRVLVPGVNNAKVGRMVEKGPWRGLPLFTLTLEERATCPRSCHLWSECYGNAMPFSRRHQPGDALEAALDRELADLLERHPGGIAVRVHVLGDFYSFEYLCAWLEWMEAHPGLHVFGYTAHPWWEQIGSLIAAANDAWPDRFAIRFSLPATSPRARNAVTTIWRQPEGPRVAEGLVCPAQTGRTEACATCGLCWSPAMRDQPIVFVGHGMRRREGGRGV